MPNPSTTVAGLIDVWHENQREGGRPHLGASLLGHPCDRWLWLSFRWAVIEAFHGRILRLFRRGQREEKTVVEDLIRIGCDIHSTGVEQSRVDFGQHVSGSIDGIVESGVPEAPTKRHILEIKTHSLKSFKDLLSKGVQESKPQHWSQMQLYMHGTQITRALYYAVCKDNDEIYTERVHYDKTAAEALVERGHRITRSEHIPEPLSADPSWYQCKYCAAHDFCFGSQCTKEVNCRTCAHSTPMPNSTWTCARWGNAEIPLEAQRDGCDCHVLHPDLVPWPWTGGTEDGFCAAYEIDGKSTLNGEGDANVFSSRELLGLGAPPEPEEEVELPF